VAGGNDTTRPRHHDSIHLYMHTTIHPYMDTLIHTFIYLQVCTYLHLIMRVPAKKDLSRPILLHMYIGSDIDLTYDGKLIAIFSIILRSECQTKVRILITSIHSKY
jgi:hypothetical protein